MARRALLTAAHLLSCIEVPSHRTVSCSTHCYKYMSAAKKRCGADKTLWQQVICSRFAAQQWVKILQSCRCQKVDVVPRQGQPCNPCASLAARITSSTGQPQPLKRRPLGAYTLGVSPITISLALQSTQIFIFRPHMAQKCSFICKRF